MANTATLGMALLLLGFMGSGSSFSQTQTKRTPGSDTGVCVYYSDKLQGHVVASGEKYDKDAMTAAHKTLPFGTRVKVTNLKNNKSVVVRVNDRGPHGSKSKIIEVSGKAARELDMISDGKADVEIEVVASEKK